jgi:hypothetical protein
MRIAAPPGLRRPRGRMIEGLQGTMITGGGIMMIDAGLILIMTVAGTGKTEDVTRRKTVMMKGRLGTGIADGPAEVEKSLAAEESGAGQKQESWKDVLPLVVDDAKFSLSLSCLEIGVVYMPTVYYFSLDLRNIVRIVIVRVGSLWTATSARTWTGYYVRIHLQQQLVHGRDTT